MYLSLYKWRVLDACHHPDADLPNYFRFGVPYTAVYLAFQKHYCGEQWMAAWRRNVSLEMAAQLRAGTSLFEHEPCLLEALVKILSFADEEDKVVLIPAH
jgi:hypothetical protein